MGQGVSLGKSKFVRECSSGKSFIAKTPDHGEINVPYWAVHDDSDIWKKEQKGKSGNLIVKEHWAEEKGYV